MLELGLLTPGGKARWDEFVASQPSGTVFHLSAWADVMANAFGHKTHYVTLTDGARLRGVLPLVELKSRLFGHSLISTAFCVGGGPLGDGRRKPRSSCSKRQSGWGASLSVGFIELRDTPAAAKAGPAKATSTPASSAK